MDRGLIRSITLLFTLLVLPLSACDDSVSIASSGTVFVVDVAGEEFRVRITDPAVLAEAQARVGQARRRGLQGELRRGDGGFNSGYRWHLAPETVSFADVAIELCDGRPSLVERDLEQWLNVIRRYCPWGALILRQE